MQAFDLARHLPREARRQYSWVKLKIDSPSEVSAAQKEIERLGYSTSSLADLKGMNTIFVIIQAVLGGVKKPGYAFGGEAQIRKSAKDGIPTALIMLGGVGETIALWAGATLSALLVMGLIKLFKGTITYKCPSRDRPGLHAVFCR